MSETNHGQSNNGFISGFVLGIVVGAALVFLFATKKGKRLLKLLSEEGLEGVSGIEELITEELVEEKPQPVSNKVSKVSRVSKVSNGDQDPEERSIPPLGSTENFIPHALGRIQTPARRFFKGIPKRK